MTTIITRTGKGSPLTWAEADANFTGLNDGKLEKYSNLSDLDSIPTALVNLHLNNVSNTSDADKPISTATQNALDGKVDTSSLSASSGSSLVGFIQSGTGAVATNVQAKLREVVSVKDFGAVGDGVADDGPAMLLARNHVASTGQTLVFPAGVYKYGNAINWNIPYLRIETDGVVRFRYTGTGNAFTIADTALVGLYGLYIGPSPIIIEAPSTAQNGVYIESVHHSELHFNVRGAGATYAGMRINFAVCSSFPNFTVSNNENGGVQGWYLNAKPKYALHLDKRNPGETTSYCLFENPILEGTDKGAYLDHAMGNIFVGGTMEGCPEQGAYLTENAFANKWYGTDFEANTIHDIYCLGRQNQFSDVDTLYLFTFDGTAHDNRVLGGNHNQISLVGTTYSNQIGNLVVNREGAGGTVMDLNTSNRIYNIRDAALGLNYNRPPTSINVDVVASPFTYTNNSGQDVDIAVGGGTVSQIMYGRPANSSTIYVGTVGKWKLCPGDTLQITYTVTPTVVVYSS